MWPSRKNKTKNGSSSSPSKSSSSCSSLSSSPGTPNKRSMDEVWQDISLTSLQDHTNTATQKTSSSIPNTSAAGLIFQDFFARPFIKDLPPTTNHSAPATVHQPTEPFKNSCFAPLVHGTSLSLNSGSGFHYLENNIIPPDHHIRPSQQLLHGFPLDSNSTYNASLLPAQFAPTICGKRAQENGGDHTNDPRHKRMMKNRESAARSRARKQAYTTELEQEVAHLEKENANLRKQQEQLLAASGLPKKHTLCRTSTAPF